MQFKQYIFSSQEIYLSLQINRTFLMCPRLQTPWAYDSAVQSNDIHWHSLSLDRERYIGSPAVIGVAYFRRVAEVITSFCHK